MKLYEFKMLVNCGFFAILYLSFFVYGLIWLSKGFDVEEKILEVKKEISVLRKSNDLRDIEIRRHEELLSYGKDEN